MGNGKTKNRNQTWQGKARRSEAKQLETPEMQLLVTESSAQAEVCSLARARSAVLGIWR